MRVRAGAAAQSVECLPRVPRVLGLISSTKPAVMVAQTLEGLEVEAGDQKFKSPLAT